MRPTRSRMRVSPARSRSSSSRPGSLRMQDVLHNEFFGSLRQDQIDFYREEGYLVLPDLLNDADMAPVRAAMMDKVSMIADALYADGIITDKREDRPFPYRLAELFAGLSDREFLKY